tara:strand:- start:3182 stop:3928 length:747 start_codon:yes stop_codon:yes gene_type:complete
MTIKVGMTGSNGTVGGVLSEGLKDRYEIIGFDREPGPNTAFVVDLTQSNQIRGAFQGLAAVIHLAADPDPGATWSSVRENNIEGTYNVFEECCNSGVRQVVFATTNHTQHGDTVATTPETLDPFKKRHLRLNDPPNPDSLYAVSKLFGENLGKYFSEQRGLDFVGLRIGWITKENDASLMQGTKSEDYMRAMYLSHRDCVQAFSRALETDSRFLLGYAISANDRRVFDLGSTIENLDFVPRDNAENDF